MSTRLLSLVLIAAFAPACIECWELAPETPPSEEAEAPLMAGDWAFRISAPRVEGSCADGIDARELEGAELVGHLRFPGPGRASLDRTFTGGLRGQGRILGAAGGGHQQQTREQQMNQRPHSAAPASRG